MSVYDVRDAVLIEFNAFLSFGLRRISKWNRLFEWNFLEIFLNYSIVTNNV